LTVPLATVASAAGVGILRRGLVDGTVRAGLTPLDLIVMATMVAQPLPYVTDSGSRRPAGGRRLPGRHVVRRRPGNDGRRPALTATAV
jgi:hypothetical protein